MIANILLGFGVVFLIIAMSKLVRLHHAIGLEEKSVKATDVGACICVATACLTLCFILKAIGY